LKSIILAGGSGTRLHRAVKAASARLRQTADLPPVDNAHAHRDLRDFNHLHASLGFLAYWKEERRVT
jgi:hypothetical protein